MCNTLLPFAASVCCIVKIQSHVGQKALHAQNSVGERESGRERERERERERDAEFDFI